MFIQLQMQIFIDYLTNSSSLLSEPSSSVKLLTQNKIQSYFEIER